MLNEKAIFYIMDLCDILNDQKTIIYFFKMLFDHGKNFIFKIYN